MREREAAHEHRAGGRRPIRILGGIVDKSRPAQVARPHGHLGEAPGAARLDRRGLAERREREAVAVGLLEAGRSDRPAFWPS